MNGFFRLLTFSPRLTVGALMLLFGGIGGAMKGTHSAEHRSDNPWSSSNSGGTYSAQKRADDGWGSTTRTASGRDSRSGTSYETVWVDRDGVIHEKEDMKAIDPDAFE
jgi:hypothetical protein